MKLRRGFAFLLGTLAVLAALAWWWRAPIATAIAMRIAEKRIGTDALAALEDGLHVGLCGSGSPIPDEQRAAPCTLVIAGKRMFVFDAGAGSVRNLSRMGFDPGRIERVMLTHFHSDHMDGLGELLLQRWVGSGSATPTPVHGPAGVERIVEGLAAVYAQDRDYRVAHHGAAVVPPTGYGGKAMPFALDAEQRFVVLDDDGVRIVAFAVDHTPVQPAVGYRIDYAGRSVVISGDTAPTPTLAREAKGVDLLVHEALSPTLVGALEGVATRAGRPRLAKIFADIPGYHTTPERAAEIARDAGAGMLLLSHITPPLPLAGMEAAFLGDARARFANLRVGADGDFVDLPARSTRIETSRRFR